MKKETKHQIPIKRQITETRDIKNACGLVRRLSILCQIVFSLIISLNILINASDMYFFYSNI